LTTKKTSNKDKKHFFCKKQKYNFDFIRFSFVNFVVNAFALIVWRDEIAPNGLPAHTRNGRTQPNNTGVFDLIW